MCPSRLPNGRPVRRRETRSGNQGGRHCTAPRAGALARPQLSGPGRRVRAPTPQPATGQSPGRRHISPAWHHGWVWWSDGTRTSSSVAGPDFSPRVWFCPTRAVLSAKAFLIGAIAPRQSRGQRCTWSFMACPPKTSPYSIAGRVTMHKKAREKPINRRMLVDARVLSVPHSIAHGVEPAGHWATEKAGCQKLRGQSRIEMKY